MNNPYYLYLTITLLAAALPCIFGLLRLKFLDIPSRIFLALMALGFITEVAAFIFAKTHQNNMPVYNISGLIQVMLVCLYFNYAISGFQAKKIGWYLGAGCVGVGILNLIFLQPLTAPNTYYSAFQMILVVLLTMTLIQRELQSAVFSYRIRWSVHFWFSFLMANLVIMNVFNVALYDFLLEKMGNDMNLIYGIMVGITALFNMAFAAVFFYYPLMIRNYATR